MIAETVGLLLFTGVSVGGSYLGDVALPSLLVSAGLGLAFVPATICAVAGVAPHEAGLASGLVNTARLVGGALGLAILAALATARTNSDLRHTGTGAHAVREALTAGFHVAFAVAAGFALVGGIVAVIGLPRVRTGPAARRAQAAAAVEP
jgi:hypothetical protein